MNPQEPNPQSSTQHQEGCSGWLVFVGTAFMSVVIGLIIMAGYDNRVAQVGYQQAHLDAFWTWLTATVVCFLVLTAVWLLTLPDIPQKQAENTPSATSAPQQNVTVQQVNVNPPPQVTQEKAGSHLNLTIQAQITDPEQVARFLQGVEITQAQPLQPKNALSSASDGKVCPQCGKVSNVDDNYCSNCRADLRELRNYESGYSEYPKME